MSADESAVPLLSVAAPVFNEEQGIEAVVREWAEVAARLNLSCEFVVCNDGSSDRTGEVLERLSRELPQLRVVGYGTNHGYGHAVATAIAASRGRYVVTNDSDGQFDLADAAAFIPLIEKDGYDGVTGYRVRKNDSFLRVAADRVLNGIVRILFGTKLRDTNCALKLIRREKLQGLTLEATGFPLPTEICLKLEATGAKLGEGPVHHRERAAGESKLRVWRTGWRMLWFLLYLRLRLWLWRARIVRTA